MVGACGNTGISVGESSPKDFRDTIFSPEGRYVQFTMEDAEQADYYFNMLMGNEIEERKDYIFSNVDFDESEE